MLLKKIIKIKDPKLKDLKVKGLAINSKELGKVIFSLQKMALEQMEKIY